MPKLKKKSIEQRSRADKERKQQIRGKSLHVGNLSEYNTNSQEREFSHETALLHAEGASSNIGNCTGTEKNDGSKQSSAIEMKYTISKLNEPYVAETIVDRYLKSQDKIAKSSQYIRLMRTNADYRKKENVRDRNRKQIARSSFLNKKAEQEYNTKKRKQARTDANYRIASRILQMRRAETGDSFT